MSDFELFINSIETDSDEEIEKKFNIEFLEMKDKDSWSPLHHACFHSRVGLVKLLISNHCQIDTISEVYQPIHLACEYGPIDIVKILIENKCDINAFNEFGNQSIHVACDGDDIDIVKILIDNKCDISEPDKYSGFHPIHFACQNGKIDIAKILIESKCDINASEKRGFQPIHLACQNGHIDIVKILIENKCDINASDEFGYQPIHVACLHGHIDIVGILIANKCDINASDQLGHQPIHLATKNGHIDIVKLLIENKCDINSPDKIYGYQPIHVACEKSYIDIVTVLIENKCDINTPDKWGYQPIHWACEYGQIDIVKILIANKCDINSSTTGGYKPIDFACYVGRFDIVEILIANNCVMEEKSKIALTTKLMKLYCKEGCDHLFCRKSLEDETFRKGELIGSGVFTKVYKYKISNTNREIVIKRAKSNCEDTKNIEENINKYSFRIVHKNIVRYYGALVKFGKLNIYMEYIPGGSLKDLIDKSVSIENAKVIKFSKEILEALKFIHSIGIIHREIKPDNMLLDHEETLKLTDFGWSKSLRPVSIFEVIEQASTFSGTPNYLAPEVFMGEPYDFPADIWSTGASIIHMITGKIPYHSLEPEAVMFKIRTTKKIEFTACQPISETMQSFIDDLLTPEQSNRPSAKDLLKHNFFH